MKKVIFIDIDDTLLTGDKKILDETKVAIKNYVKKGGEIILTTGRSDFSLQSLVPDLEVSPYIICNNGALAYDKKRKHLIYHNAICYEDLEQLLKYIEDMRIGAYINVLNSRYKNEYSEDLDSPLTYKFEEIKEFKRQLVFQVVIQLFHDYDRAKLIEKYLNSLKSLKICNESRSLLENNDSMSCYYYFDICNNGTNKGKAVKEVLRYLGINKEDAVAIGDHVNDLSMFDEVGLKVAMKNGYQSLKEKADIITKFDNNHNGVGEIIERITNNLL